MKKLILWAWLGTSLLLPLSAPAEVNVSIRIPLPPPIVLPAPPEVIVMPDTDVYVVPDLDVDLFFWNGWWWRQWDGRWYRSRHYNRGWGHFKDIPTFYFDVDPGWRGFYKKRDWYGHRWDYKRIPHRQLKNNWKKWDDRYWEKDGSWGVRDYKRRQAHERDQLRKDRRERYRSQPDEARRLEQRQPRLQERDRPPQPRDKRSRNKDEVPRDQDKPGWKRD